MSCLWNILGENNLFNNLKFIYYVSIISTIIYIIYLLESTIYKLIFLVPFTKMLIINLNVWESKTDTLELFKWLLICSSYMDSGIKKRMTVLIFFDKRIQITTWNTQLPNIFFHKINVYYWAKIPISMSGVFYFNVKFLLMSYCIIFFDNWRYNFTKYLNLFQNQNLQRLPHNHCKNR